MEDVSFVQRITFALLQIMSLVFLVGFASSLAASGVLLSYSPTGKQTQVARRTAVAFALLSIILWFLNWLAS